MSGSSNIRSLDCNGLEKYLEDKGFNPEVRLILKENEIDGDTFCDLRQDELERMIPNKLGVVKKLLKLNDTAFADFNANQTTNAKKMTTTATEHPQSIQKDNHTTISKQSHELEGLQHKSQSVSQLRKILEQPQQTSETVKSQSGSSTSTRYIPPGATCILPPPVAPRPKKSKPTKGNKEAFKELLKKSCDCENGNGKATIYKLKPRITNKLAEGVVEHNIDTPAIFHKYEKVLMMVGATGTGKSTLINRMINYILEVEYTDEFRFQLVIEKEISQTESQTKTITKYNICNNKFDYKLSVIDTPGFGDTTGIEEDKKTTEKIKSLFDSGTIVSIDAICFVAKYGQVRLNDFEKYVFKSVTNMFGINVKENVFVMTTCCDETYNENGTIESAPVLNQFKVLNVPFQNSFPFNNKDIFKKPVKKTVNIEYWKTSTISFNKFFEELNMTTPVSIKLTQEVLQKQYDIIHVKLPDFIRNLKKSIHNINKHEMVLEKLKKHKESPEEKDFSFSVEVQKETMVDITEKGIFCIQCKVCKKICHYPCDVPDSKQVKKCIMMSTKWFKKDVCIACPKKCPWTDHDRLRKKPGFITVKERHTKEELKNEYLAKRKDQEDKWEDLVKACEADMVSAYSDMLEDLKNTQKDIDFLNNQCLSKDPTSLKENITEIIQNEKLTREDGHEKRIVVLENLVITLNHIFKDFEDASYEDKVKQATKIFYKQE